MKASRTLALGALLVTLGFLTVYPLAMLVYGSFHSTPPGMAGEFNLNGYRGLLTERAANVLWNSLTIAFTKTVLSLVLAVYFAWVIARTDTPFRGTMEILITLPFFIPPILTATAWGMLGNPEVGTINLAWKWLSGATTPLVNVFGSCRIFIAKRRIRDPCGCGLVRCE
jgi:iron(III) transport system permease protein